MQLGMVGRDSTRAQRVNLPAMVSNLSALWGHSCAVMSGVVMCWGANSEGQLGSNSRDRSRPPSIVGGGLLNVTSIAAGGRHSCAVSAGALKCWGQNQGGQLGLGNLVDQLAPQVVQGVPGQPIQIVAGYYHTCVRTQADGVWCWGYNEHGQVGDGTWSDRSVPRRVWGL
jgi:alpha-tubulin suppressor-like RCC1 family protein